MIFFEVFYYRDQEFELRVPAVKLKNYFNKDEDKLSVAIRVLSYHKASSIYNQEVGGYAGFSHPVITSITADANDHRVFSVKMNARCYYLKLAKGDILDFEITEVNTRYIIGNVLGIRVVLNTSDLISRGYEYNNLKQSLSPSASKKDQNKLPPIGVGSVIRSVISDIQIDSRIPYRSTIFVTGKIPVQLMLFNA